MKKGFPFNLWQHYLNWSLGDVKVLLQFNPFLLNSNSQRSLQCTPFPKPTPIPVHIYIYFFWRTAPKNFLYFLYLLICRQRRGQVLIWIFGCLLRIEVDFPLFSVFYLFFGFQYSEGNLSADQTQSAAKAGEKVYANAALEGKTQPWLKAARVIILLVTYSSVTRH